MWFKNLQLFRVKQDFAFDVFEAQLADRDVTIELSDAAKAWLIERGYDDQPSPCLRMQ